MSGNFESLPYERFSAVMTINTSVKQDRIWSKIGFGASIAQDVSNAGCGLRTADCLGVQCNATTLLNINQNKKLEDVMANSTDNQVKSSMLGAVTQGR
ncbi:hypothetical protein ACH48_17730 [Aeromonas caviae]|nr:hypothetical protein ACH48_17730 [Aeromonas caviae]